MTQVTAETIAELRRLHAEFTAADERLARVTLDANEMRMRQEYADEAERWLASMWIGHGQALLDALTTTEASLAAMDAPVTDAEVERGYSALMSTAEGGGTDMVHAVLIDFLTTRIAERNP